MKMKTAGEARNNKKRGFPYALLGAAALIAVIAANVMVWNGARARQGQVEDLKAQIVQVNKQVSQVAAPPAGLESKLQAAQAALALAGQGYPADIDRNDVFDFMLITAEVSEVEILPLAFEGMESAGDSYFTLIYRTTITGTLDNTADFMTRLHKDMYPTMTITECTVQRMSAPDPAIPEDEIEVSIDLSISLYVASVESGEDNA